MQSREILKNYIPLVDFIADIIGRHCEVLLQDIVNTENSVIHIRNGYISGRYVGCPLTDLGFKILENKMYSQQNAIVNYRGVNDSGEKLISSTYFIKDEKGILIGLLCVNILDSFANSRKQVEAYLNSLIHQEQPPRNENEEINESLKASLDSVVTEAVQKLLAQYDTSVERISSEEKIAIVQNLKDNGIFKIKGAISQTAAILKISESTVYRYMSSK